MPDAPMRIGIIGLGAWGSRAHLPAIATLPDVQVVAIADRDPATAQAAVDAGPFPLGIYPRYNQRLAASFITDIRLGAVTWPSFADDLAAQRALAATRVSLDERRRAAVPDALNPEQE
jgi:hypothetical protein